MLVSVQCEMSSAGLFVDAQVRSPSTSIPASPTPFVWTTAVDDSFGSINTTTGVITFPFDGEYTFTFSFNPVTTGTVKQFYMWAEKYIDGVWVKQEYTARIGAVRLSDQTQIPFFSTNNFKAGEQIRFVVWGSATGISILTQSIDTGFTVPASRLQITGVKTI